MASSVAATSDDRLQTSAYQTSQSPLRSLPPVASSSQSTWSTHSEAASHTQRSNSGSASSPSPSPSLRAYEKCLRAKFPRGGYPDIGFPMESGAYPNSGFPESDLPTTSGTPRYGYPSHAYPESGDLPGVIPEDEEDDDDDYEYDKSATYLQLRDPGQISKDGEK